MRVANSNYMNDLIRKVEISPYDIGDAALMALAG
jgi:hypothetical protein